MTKYLERGHKPEPVRIDSRLVDKDILKGLLVELGRSYGIDMESRTMVKDDALNCYYDPIQDRIIIPTPDDYYSDPENTMLKMLFTMTAPHEFFHFLYSANAQEHPSDAMRSVLSLGTGGYFRIEEGRAKSQQFKRVKALARRWPKMLPKENMEHYIYTKELKASAMHMIAYNMREQGKRDLEIMEYLKRYSHVETAASTTLRSRLGMPITGDPFPGYLTYYIGMKEYESLADDVKATLENGKMRPEIVADGRYGKWVKAGLVREEPFYRYDEDKVLDTVKRFVEKI